MRQQLEEWGLPPWFVEGEAPPKEPADTNEKRPPTERKAKQGKGPEVELPRAADAENLFYEAIRKLRHALDRIDTRKEFLKDNRFRLLSDYSNPSSGPMTIPEGTRRVPHEPLPELIALYALAGEPLEPLLEILHPDHPRAGENRELKKALKKKLEELRTITGHLAIMVRGGSVNKGRPSEQDPMDQAAGRYVTKRSGKSATDEEIARELAEYLPEQRYSEADVERLREFDLEPDRPD